MISIETDRLILFSNNEIKKGYLQLVVRNTGVDLFKLKCVQSGDNEFAILSKEHGSIRIGGVGLVIKDDGKIIEVKYSIEDEYQGKGYMSEALESVIPWLFGNTNIDKIEALCINDTSTHLLRDKHNFVFAGYDMQSKEYPWYEKKRTAN